MNIMNWDFSGFAFIILILNQHKSWSFHNEAVEIVETDHNQIHNEIDSTPSIDRNICTPSNEPSKSSDNINQNNLQTEDENISEVTPVLNNTVCTPMISNEKNVSRRKINK